VSEQPDGEPPRLEIRIDKEHQAGAWANYAQVSHSPYEFTLDFVRIDFAQQPPVGMVVSRVSVSPLFVSQLIDALQANWKLFAEKSLPKEVFGDGTENDQS